MDPLRPSGILGVLLLPDIKSTLSCRYARQTTLVNSTRIASEILTTASWKFLPKLKSQPRRVARSRNLPYLVPSVTPPFLPAPILGSAVSYSSPLVFQVVLIIRKAEKSHRIKGLNRVQTMKAICYSWHIGQWIKPLPGRVLARARLNFQLRITS